MSTFHGRVSIINKFCEYFKGSFSKNQFAAFTSFLYGLVNEYKRVNISSLAQALQRDYETLNAKRINLLKNQRTTGFAKDGLLIIDDTGILKPYAQATEGVSYQH